MAFYFDTEMVEGAESCILGYKKENKNEHDVTVKVNPTYGDQLYCYRVDGFEIVHYDTHFSLKSYYTGQPILWPFPNRMTNCFYTFEGENHWQQKHGLPQFLHSLIWDESWERAEPVITDDGISLETWIDIDEKHPVYEGYPWKCRLTLIWSVTRNGLHIAYKMENKDDKVLPFGLSFHTFFKKLCGDEGSFVCVPADTMMELTPALLPTGKLLPVDGQWFDIRKPTPVGQLDLDNCYTTMRKGERVYCDYPALGLRVYQDSTDDFTHMQVFTPQGKPFFCVEKQTCSTDAPNLDDKGFKEEAHLLRVQPGETKEGKVDIVYEIYK